MVVSSIPVQHSNLRAMMIHRSHPTSLQPDVTQTTTSSKPIINSTAHTTSLMSIMLSPNYSDAGLIHRMNVLLLSFKKRQSIKHKKQLNYHSLLIKLFEQNRNELAPYYCEELLQRFKTHKQTWPKRSAPYTLLNTLIFQLKSFKNLNTNNYLHKLNTQLNELNILLKL